MSDKVVGSKNSAKSKQKRQKSLVLPVLDIKGKEVEQVELPKEIFAVEASPRLIAQYVRVYLTNQRAGTASIKTRSEVKGSTRKLYSQKGTGRARHGDIKAPIFVGGGVVFGPKPRKFELKMNKKQRRKALFAVLSQRVKNGEVVVLSDEFLTGFKKTKDFVEALETLNLADQKIALVFPAKEKAQLYLVIRNLENVLQYDAESLNAYFALQGKRLVFVKKSLEVLRQLYLKNEN